MIVDRLVAHAIAIYDPEEHEDRGERRPGRVGRHPHPPRGDRLPRHLPPRSHRRHPRAEGVLRPGLCDRPPAVPRRRHRPSRRTQDQGPRHPHRPTRRTSKPQVKVYARVDARDLEPDALAVGEIEKLGAATLTKIRDLGRPPPSRHPTRAEHGPPRRRRLPRPTRLDARPRRSSATATASSRDAPSTPGPATSTTPSPTTRTDHPAKPGQRTSPASAGDTTAPRPPVAGGTSARPTATTSGTGRTARRTSSPTAAPIGCPDSASSRRCRRSAAESCLG